MQLKIYLLSALFLSILFLSPLQADNKFYLGASIGENYIEQDNVFLGEDFDDSDTGYKVFGGYQFHRNFAVEANYT